MSLHSHFLTIHEGMQVDAEVGLTACDMTACEPCSKKALPPKPHHELPEL